MRAIAAGAAGIHQMLTAHRRPGRQLAHDLGSGDNFLDRLALGPQRHQKAADLRGRGPAGHDGPHKLAHGVRGKRLTVKQVIDG